MLGDTIYFPLYSSHICHVTHLPSCDIVSYRCLKLCIDMHIDVHVDVSTMCHLYKYMWLLLFLLLFMCGRVCAFVFPWKRMKYLYSTELLFMVMCTAFSHFYVVVLFCLFSVYISMFQSDLMMSSLGLHVMNGDERNLYVYCCWRFDSWDSLSSSGECILRLGMSNCGALFSTFCCSLCWFGSSHADTKLYLQHLLFLMINRYFFSLRIEMSNDAMKYDNIAMIDAETITFICSELSTYRIIVGMDGEFISSLLQILNVVDLVPCVRLCVSGIICVCHSCRIHETHLRHGMHAK